MTIAYTTVQGIKSSQLAHQHVNLKKKLHWLPCVSPGTLLVSKNGIVNGRSWKLGIGISDILIFKRVYMFENSQVPHQTG